MPHQRLLSEDRPPRLRTTLILASLLPLFGQVFHYLKDLLPLWALSKVFPLLSLPLALVLFRYKAMPGTRQVLLSFAWCLLVPSFAGIYYFNQDFFTGVAAQVKMLPMLYFFSFLGLLLSLRPNLRELATGFLVWGVVTYAALVLLWAVVPQNWYSSSYVFGSAPFFSVDSRGNRIRMPMFFGMILVFYCYRRFLGGGRPLWLLGAMTGFALTLWVVKTRAMVVGAAGVLALVSFFAVGRRMRLVVMLLAPVALAGVFSFGYLASMFSTGAGSGFDVRWETAIKVADFLGIDMMRWLFGVGTISPLSDDSLFAYFNHFFFLADVTWLGILFEFGLIGALIILLYQVRGFLLFRGIRKRLDSPFLSSLNDYLIYVLLISNLYPPTLTPGETAVILAIFVYVLHELAEEEDAEDDEDDEEEAAEDGAEDDGEDEEDEDGGVSPVRRRQRPVQAG